MDIIFFSITFASSVIESNTRTGGMRKSFLNWCMPRNITIHNQSRCMCMSSLTYGE